MLIKVFGKDCNHGDFGGFIMSFTSLKILKYHLKTLKLEIFLKTVDVAYLRRLGETRTRCAFSRELVFLFVSLCLSYIKGLAVSLCKYIHVNLKNSLDLDNEKKNHLLFLPLPNACPDDFSNDVLEL